MVTYAEYAPISIFFDGVATAPLKANFYDSLSCLAQNFLAQNRYSILFLLDLGEEISDLAYSNTLAKNLLVIMPATVITAHRCEVSSFI